MTQASETLDPLFVNHLAFLAAHRGTVRIDAAGIHVDSDIPGFTSWTPWNEETPVPREAEAVRLVPGCGTGWGERLAALGFAPAEMLSYMEAGTLVLAHRAPAQIARAVGDAGGRAFADVQFRGFVEPGEDDADYWRDRFAAVALANVDRADQSFLIAETDGAPAAVALVVHAGGVDGLYAVATPPEHRRKGLSFALLAAAYDTAKRGGRRLILQAMKGSYAEGFYTRAGFALCYESQVHRR